MPNTPTPTEVPVVVVPAVDETVPSDPDGDPTDPADSDNGGDGSDDVTANDPEGDGTTPTEESAVFVHTNPTGTNSKPVELDQKPSLWGLWLALAVLIIAGGLRYGYLRKYKGYSNAEALKNLIPGMGGLVYAVSSALPSKSSAATTATTTQSSQTGAGLASAMKEINAMKKAEAMEQAKTAAASATTTSTGLKAPIKRPAQYSVNRASQTAATTAPAATRPAATRPAAMSTSAAAAAVLKDTDVAKNNAPKTNTAPVQRAPVKRPPQFSSNPNVARQARLENEAPKRPAAQAQTQTQAQTPFKKPSDNGSNVEQKIAMKNAPHEVEGKTATPRKISPAPSANTTTSASAVSAAKLAAMQKKAEERKAEAEAAMKEAEKARKEAEEALKAAEEAKKNADEARRVSGYTAPAAATATTAATAVKTEKPATVLKTEQFIERRKQERVLPVWNRPEAKPEPNSAVTTYAQLKMAKDEANREKAMEDNKPAEPFKKAIPNAPSNSDKATGAGSARADTPKKPTPPSPFRPSDSNGSK